jgi:hypothetical protein
MQHILSGLQSHEQMSAKPKRRNAMPDRAKQLMELLWRHIGEPEALALAANQGVLDLDATQFLNPDPGELNTLVLAPDSKGRQLIVDRAHDEPWAFALPPGHWRVRGEVMCWAVQVSLHPQTLPGSYIPFGATNNRGLQDLIRDLCERYEPLGASQELADTVRFQDATPAAEFTTDLWALLAEHGTGATFTTTLFARTIAFGPYLWTVTRQETLETLEPLVADLEAKARGRPETRKPGQQAKNGGE